MNVPVHGIRYTCEVKQMIRVLYVDDELTLLELCKQFLERSGDFTVMIATSAPEAIRILGQERVDAIVSDYQMPEMDGIEFLKSLKTEGNTTPFIIFTGKGREEVMVEALNAGADFYLQKGGEAKSQFVELSHKIKKLVDSRAAEDALRKNEARFRGYFNMPLHGIAITSPDKGWLEVNDRICSMLGYTRDELFHKNWAELTHPDDLAVNLEQFNRVLCGQIEQYAMDKRFIRKDGGVIWTNISVGCIRKSDGNVDYFICLMEDITERKQMEKALRESEGRYHSILDNMQDAYVRADANGHIIMASPSVAHLFRYDSANDLIGLPAVSLYRHPDERQEIIRIAKEQGEVHDFICEGVRKDGTSFWVSVNVQFTFDSNGKVNGTDGFIRDITERKRAEAALQEAALRWQSTFDSTQDAICIVDADQRIVMCNRTMQEIIGVKNIDDLVGRYCWEVVHNTMEPIPGCPSVRMRQSLSREQMELKMGKRWVVVTADPILNKTRTLIGAVHNIRDITDHKQAENMIALANRKLSLMNDVTYQYIQNKVTGLRGYTELSKEVKTEAERLAFIEKEEHILADIHQLIENTKEYQKLGVNRLRWIPLEQSIRIAVSLVSPKQGISIKINLHGLELYADSLIEKIFYKLIDNAEKHGKTLTHIIFTCNETNGGLILICEDDGVGISPERKARLFERDGGEKSGFDLFFIRECLALYGMSIAETGESGKGARFEISVPKGAYRFTGTGIK